MRSLFVVLVTSLLLAAGAAAQQPLQPPQARTAHPGAAAMAAAGNVVFAPVRFAVTLFNAAAGGLTGFFTLDDARAADDVFALTSGQGFLQPEMLTGQESLQVGELRFNLQVTNRGDR